MGQIGLGAAAPPSVAPEERSPISRIFSSGGWAAVAHGASAAALLATTMLIARSDGPVALGRYTYLLWLMQLLATLLTVGMPVALTKFVAESAASDDGSDRAALRMALRTHAAILALAGGAAVALVACRAVAPAPTAVVVAGMAAIVAVTDVEAWFAGHRRFRSLAVASVAGAATQLGVAVAVATARLPWMDFVGVFVLANGVSLATLASIRQPSRGRVAPLAVERRAEFVKLTAVLTLAVVVESMVWGRPELFFLNRYHPGVDLGLYGAALRIASLAAMMPMVLGAAFLPEMSALKAAGDRIGMHTTLRRTTLLLVAVAAPLAIGGALLAGPGVTLVYGARFGGASTATSVLLLGALLNAPTVTLSAVVMVGPRPRLLAEVGVPAAVLNVVLDFVLVPPLGPVGAALATGMVQLACVAISALYSWRRLGMPIPVARLAEILLLASLGGLVARAIQEMIGGTAGLVAAVPAGGFVYVASLAVVTVAGGRGHGGRPRAGSLRPMTVLRGVLNV